LSALCEAKDVYERLFFYAGLVVSIFIVAISASLK